MIEPIAVLAPDPSPPVKASPGRRGSKTVNPVLLLLGVLSSSVSWSIKGCNSVGVAATGMFSWYHGVQRCTTPVAVAVAAQPGARSATNDTAQGGFLAARLLPLPHQAASYLLGTIAPLPQGQVFHPVGTILGLVHLGDQFQVADALPSCDLELMPVDDASKRHTVPLSLCRFA